MDFDKVLENFAYAMNELKKLGWQLCSVVVTLINIIRIVLGVYVGGRAVIQVFKLLRTGFGDTGFGAIEWGKNHVSKLIL